VVRHLRTVFGLTLAATFLLAFTGCAEKSPEEQIAKIRSEYEIQLNNWKIVAPVVEEVDMEAMAEGEEAAPAEGEDTPVEGEEAMAEGEEIAAEPASVNINFDIVVHFRGRTPLAGLTVDITHANAAEQDKAVFHQWVETQGIGKGNPGQVAFVLEGVAFEEGDLFAAVIAAGVPTDLSAYREFSEPAP
jgi:hypothetical protein